MKNILYGFEEYVKREFENEKTIQGYVYDANAFSIYIKNEGIPWQQIKERHITQYNTLLKRKGYSDNSIARKNSSLRLFLKYLRKQGIMIHNPMEDVRQPTLQKREVEWKEEEKKRLEEMMKKEARDYLLYVFLQYEKIKISEIVSLKWNQIDIQNHIIYLEKKAVSLKEETIQLLGNWKEKESEQEFIFTNRQGNMLSVNGAHFIIKKYLKEIQREDLRPNDLMK